MAEWGKVVSFTEIRQLNRRTNEIETHYRYTCETVRGNVFSVIVDEATARGPELDKALAAKAKDLEHMFGK